MFTGREWAPANFGFYEYRARAYHPGLGRFMSEDPKGFDAGDYNLFRYCGNDPEDRVDPMGLNAIFSASGDWARIANNGENIGGDSGGGSSGGGGSSPKAEQAGGGTDALAVEVSGINFGDHAPKNYENAPWGDPTRRGSPNSLIEVGTQKGKTGDTVKLLQAVHVSYDQSGKRHVEKLTGDIASKEHVDRTPVMEKGVKVEGSKNSNERFVQGSNGKIRDYLQGVTLSPNSKASGQAVMRQTYILWYNGERFWLPVAIDQTYSFENGRNTQNTLNIIGP